MTITNTHYWNTAYAVCTPAELQALTLRDQHNMRPHGISLAIGISRRAVRDRLDNADRKIQLALNQETPCPPSPEDTTPTSPASTTHANKHAPTNNHPHQHHAPHSNSPTPPTSEEYPPSASQSQATSPAPNPKTQSAVDTIRPIPHNPHRRPSDGNATTKRHPPASPP